MARRMPNPALFVCDIQERFRPSIWEYPKVIATAQKMIRACPSSTNPDMLLSTSIPSWLNSPGSTLSIPIYATTQSLARLGPLCSELVTPFPFYQVDKTAFSMMVPELRFNLTSASPHPYQIAIVGIETHICVTQTVLDLVAEGHKVYVLADGVSSCHEGEVGVALRRLAKEGAVITTSEGWLYECMGDANIAEFKLISGLVKETKESTKEALQTLCKF